MNSPAHDGVGRLTEKEKQTLRLIVRGHDAKSAARSLDLSVHTINERLREARRKLAVSSSREAARILLAAEGVETVAHPPPPPDILGDSGIGEDATPRPADAATAPIPGAERHPRRSWILSGAFVMMLVASLLMLAATPHSAAPPPPSPASTESAALVDDARRWLALLDAGRWDESYAATGAAFRKLNTVQAWTAASERARTPLGAMVSRVFVAQENLPAPPAGYEVVRFRTTFANRSGAAVETVAFDREDGGWRVVGVTIG